MSKRLRQIRAGRLCIDALYSMALPSDTGKARADKARCTTAGRQALNLRYSWQKCELSIAANFGVKDQVATLTYDDDHLPLTVAEAKRCIQKFIRLFRAYRLSHGQDLKYIYVTESKHGDGRVHHHMIFNGTGADYEIIRSLWIYGNNLEFNPVDLWGYEELAKYLTKEPREYGVTDVGARTWTPSMNLSKPERPPAVDVPDNVTLAAPPGAIILDNNGGFKNEYGEFCYIKYLLPYDPHKAKRSRPKSRRKRKKN